MTTRTKAEAVSERPGFCHLWLAYRRMYVETCLVWAVVFGLTEASDVFHMVFRVSRQSEWHGIVLFVAFVVVPFTCGAIGNRRYLSRALRALATTRAFGLTGDQAGRISPIFINTKPRRHSIKTKHPSHMRRFRR